MKSFSKHHLKLALGLAPASLLFGGCGLLIGIEEAYLADRGGNGNTGRGLSFSSDSCNVDIDLDRAVIQGCLLRVSCDPAFPPFNVSDCVTYSWQLASTREACGYKAESCDDIEDCTGRETIDGQVQACEATPGVWICEDQEAIFCGDYPYKENCAALNADCLGGGDRLTGCTPRSEPDCSDKAEGASYCSGNDLYTCSDGVAYGWSCAAGGTGCVESTPGLAYCNPFATECENASSATCADDALEFCFDTGYFGKFDCAASDLNCQTVGSSVGYCLADGCDTDAECEEGCLDDETMQLCIGGAKVELDCLEFGFDGCYDGDLPSGVEYAGCYTLGEAEYGADDSCVSADNGVCGETLDSGDSDYCAPKTDATDCGDTCVWSHDGFCDEDAGYCEPGTDTSDCSA